jgi:diguanylate cyclase (GGDEF)-like protein
MSDDNKKIKEVDKNKDSVVDTKEVMKNIDDPKEIKKKSEKQKNKYWKNIALFDNLTRVPNRNSFEIIVDNFKDSIKYMGIVDVDFFKKVNDSYGHLIGDVVLKGLAKFLDDKLIILRFGGEEFVLVMAGSEFNTEESTEEYLNELREQISQLKFDNGKGGNLSITVSLGYTEFIKDKDVNELIKNADCALYVAKESGRNLVIKYVEGMDCGAHADNENGELIKNEEECKNCKEEKEIESMTKLWADEYWITDKGEIIKLPKKGGHSLYVLEHLDELIDEGYNFENADWVAFMEQYLDDFDGYKEMADNYRDDILASMLENGWIRVQKSPSGEIAIDIYDWNKGNINVLDDYILKNSNGVTYVFVSIYAQDRGSDEGESIPIDMVLEKGIQKAYHKRIKQ